MRRQLLLQLNQHVNQKSTAVENKEYQSQVVVPETTTPLMIKSRPKNVQTSLLSDFVKDKRLYAMFRQELAKHTEKEHQKKLHAQTVTLDLIGDQL
jgi:hypothetical protein